MNDILRRKKENDYQRWIAEIVTKQLRSEIIKDYVTVVDTKLSGDGSQLKVFFSFFKNEEKLFKELNIAKGFIKTQLSKFSNERKIPNLIFEIDEVSKNVERIDKILRDIKGK